MEEAMEKVKLSHGGGGETMHELISLVIKNFSLTKVAGGTGLDALDDSAIIPFCGKYLAFTTDAYVVQPIFFPGGDIGKLSVSGTINDLAMMGAKPIALSSSFVVGEGLSFESLTKISESMNRVCEEVPVPIVTGDTKVIEDIEMIITTSGLGVTDKPITDSGMKPGDKIIVNGSVGDHGIAIMASREGIEFETELKSDCAQLWSMVEKILRFDIHAMKDPTRGGLANAINEMAAKSGVGVLLHEDRIPIREEVRAASEMLGIDPFSVANEGKAIISVREADAKRVLDALKKTPQGRDAAIIGEVTEEKPGRVMMETVIGGRKILIRPAGDPVPRVC
jgi:hydrogenase expression/formation protein HypE